MKEIKAILFDADGVLIRLPHYFSKELELQDYKKVEDILNACFISCFIDSRKCHGLFWEHVVKELKNTPVGIEPDEIAFFDDIQKNVDTALKFGVRALLFENVSQFREEMILLGLNATHG